MTNKTITLSEQKVIVLPNLLNNPVYVAGLRQPIEAVAEILDAQEKYEHAMALRNAATICETFAEINLNKSAKLLTGE